MKTFKPFFSLFPRTLTYSLYSFNTPSILQPPLTSHSAAISTNPNTVKPSFLSPQALTAIFCQKASLSLVFCLFASIYPAHCDAYSIYLTRILHFFTQTP